MERVRAVLGVPARTAQGRLHDAIETNAIECLNARFRRAVRHRGHFPNEQAALKVLYLVANQQRPNRADLVGRTSGWKQILNALTIHYGERITANY